MSVLRAMATFIHDGTEYRVWGAGVKCRRVGSRRWEVVALSTLARTFAVGEGPWPWLKERGITRPSRSGFAPVAEKRRSETEVEVKLRLEKNDAEKLAKLADAAKITKSELVTRWIRRARKGR